MSYQNVDITSSSPTQLALRSEAQQSLKTYGGSSTKFGKAAFCKTDVANQTQLENMFVKAEESFGSSGADIVVPGAGVL